MRHALVIVLVGLVGCAPTGEIVLHVDTDAPVPRDPTAALDAARGPALFDRLRIEVLRGDVPALDTGASRDFAVDEGRFVRGEVSIGIAPPIGDATLTARVRLFRADRLVGGEPPAGASLDTTVALPAIGRTERLDLTVVLRTEDVGRPLGRPDGIVADRGVPTSSIIGTWTGALRVPCATAPGPGEACVPGGAFWMGAPPMLGASGVVASTEHLVVVSPFFVDLAEVTVADFRKGFPRPGDSLAPRTHADDPLCVYTAAPAELDARPMSCVARTSAEVYCRSKDRALPTEAQLQFLASGRGAEQLFVWGDENPTCGDAVFGLGAPLYDDTCGQLGGRPNTRPAGAGRLDRISLDGGAVVDLAGNVAEIVRDAWSEPDPAALPGLTIDPVRAAGASDDSVAYGGSWLVGPVQLHATSRDVLPRNALGPAVGFRCVRPGG